MMARAKPTDTSITDTLNPQADTQMPTAVDPAVELPQRHPLEGAQVAVFDDDDYLHTGKVLHVHSHVVSSQHGEAYQAKVEYDDDGRADGDALIFVDDDDAARYDPAADSPPCGYLV